MASSNGCVKRGTPGTPLSTVCGAAGGAQSATGSACVSTAGARVAQGLSRFLCEGRSGRRIDTNESAIMNDPRRQGCRKTNAVEEPVI